MCVAMITFSLTAASADPVAVVINPEQVQQAAIGSKSVTPPGLVPILALSVAAITLVRRRVRH